MRTLAGIVFLFAACGGSTPTPGAPSAPVAVVPASCPAVAPTETPGSATAVAPAAAAGVRVEGALVFDGTPEVPAELRAKLGQYLDTRSAGVVDLAPDGKALLIATRFGNAPQLHEVVMPMGARTQITFGAEPVTAASYTPGAAATSLLYRADAGGNELYQLYRLDRATGNAVRLTDGTSRNESPSFSRDGKRLAWVSTARNGRDFDVWIGDGRDPASGKRVLETEGQWATGDWARDGNRLLLSHQISITESELYVLSLAGDVATSTRISPVGTKAAYDEALFAADGKRLYVTSDREGEFTELYEVDLARASASGADGVGDGWRSLSRDLPWDVETLALSSDGRTLAFTTNEDGFSILHLLDTRSGKHRRAAGVPTGGVIGGLRFARAAAVLAFSYADARTAGDAYTYDLGKKKATRWTASEIGGLDAGRFVAPTLVHVDSFDKLRVPALYYKPAGAGPFPVIITIHGGPEGQSRPGFSAFDQLLLAQGIALIYPNVRGSTGYGKTYVGLDNGFAREDSVKDIGAVLDWIGQQPELDAHRVGVHGGSYGGYMVLAALSHYSDRIAAGVDVVGISSWVTFLENTSEYRRDLRRVEYGDERDPAMRKHLEAISPLTSVDKIKSALFVVQGANDPRVPASEAEQIVSAVRATGKEVWYLLAKNEGHGFAKKENRDAYLLLTTMFFARHLGL